MHFAVNQQLAVAMLQPECNHNNEASQGKPLIRQEAGSSISQHRLVLSKGPGREDLLL